jgi:hypothetical protein
MDYFGVAVIAIMLIYVWELEQIRRNITSIQSMIFSEWSPKHTNIDPD